ncbi:hypothetical protein ColKHC_02410 [Colletotrichum higginsianum]|nr:hypothetical protein ColKHC_02410 [Colletotrichum higginsianum]
MAHVEQQANQHGRSLGQITTSAFVTCDPVVTSTNLYTTTAIAASPTTSWVATRSSPSSAPTANVVINGNGVTDAANPVITGAGDGANHQHGGGQTGGGSNPGGNGQNDNPNGAPFGSAGQAPGYGVYGSYGSYGQGASAQPGQSEVIGAPAPGQPGAAGAGGQPGGQPGQSAVPGVP